MRVAGTFVSILVVLGCAEEAAHLSQEGPRVITKESGCDSCRIELRRVAMLGDSVDPASVRPDAAVAGCMVGVTRDSLFLLSGTVGGGQVLLYEGGGAAVRSIGRQGQGPGEFGTNLRILVAPPDTVFVVDNSNLRIVKTNLAGDVLESFRLPDRVHSLARLSDGRFVVHSRPSTDPDAPLFRVLDESGAPMSTFGKSTRTLAEKDQWVLGQGETADFWAASMWEYRLYRGDARTGALREAIRREVDWFPPSGEWSEDILVSEAPPPLLTHLYESSDALVWTFITLADRDWEVGIPDAGSAEWMERSFDTIIEVIDVERGEVLAEHRSDHWLGPICGTQLVYGVLPTAVGDTRAVVYEPILHR